MSPVELVGDHLQLRAALDESRAESNANSTSD